MKKTSKVLAIVLALCLMLAVGAVAFASGEPSGEAGPTIKTISVNVSGQATDVDVAFVDGKEYIDIDVFLQMLGLDNGSITWASYQDYLYNAVASNAPDPQQVHDQIYALTSWADMDMTTAPWDQMFTTLGVSTWPEFVLAGGVGLESQVQGSANVSG